MEQFAAILAAAGLSARFREEDAQTAGVPGEAQAVSLGARKPFVDLLGEPVWYHSARRFAKRADVAQLLVVVSPENEADFREQYAAAIEQWNVQVVAGGRRRQDSVRHGLDQVDAGVPYAIVHDAARPCVTDEEIDGLIQATRDHGAALLGCPVWSTVKRVSDGRVQQTIDRNGLYLALTPQGGRMDWLKSASAKFAAEDVTDEARLLELDGREVVMVPGHATNIKITTRVDLAMARAILSAQTAET